MVEEIKISEKELKDLNDKIEFDKRQEKTAMEKEIRDKIAAEEKLKSFEENNKRLQEELSAIKKSQEEKELTLKAEFQKQIDDLKNSRQSIVQNNNPFNEKNTKDFVPDPFKDVKIQKAIEENSRTEFLKRYKTLPNEWGTS